MSARAQHLIIRLDAGRQVSGLFQRPPDARACYVLAHGAGAGMTDAFMTAIAAGLTDRSIATLRFQFHYMEEGSKRPDPPKLAQLAVRSAVKKASRLAPELAIFAGGKSFGGRMTSQAQAESPLPGVRGLVFLGFPLHPSGRPSDERGKHLSDVRVPMFFVQGTRDALAKLELLQPLVKRLGPAATLQLVPEADHSFHVPGGTGCRDSDVRNEILDRLAEWITAHLGDK